MTADVRELLPLYALDLLDAGEAAAVARAVAADPALAGELEAYRAAAADLVVGLAPVAPPAAVRTRLLASAVPAATRFERFAQRVAEIYDVAVERARALIGMIDDPAAAEAAFPGVQLFHFQGGPAVAGADCGFLVVAAGTLFPWHRHDGDERVLVLQGTMIDRDGRAFGPGDEDHQPAGSEHDFRAGDGEDLIFCARVWGVDFDVPRPG